MKFDFKVKVFKVKISTWYYDLYNDYIKVLKLLKCNHVTWLKKS